MFQSSSVPGRKFSQTTSATEREPAEQVLTLRLPQIARDTSSSPAFDGPEQRVPAGAGCAASPGLLNGPMVRMKSPTAGCSTFTTSAPHSPSSPAQNGAPILVPRSRTLRPSRGGRGVATARPGRCRHR